MERRFIFITQAKVQGQVPRDLPVVVDVEAVETAPRLWLDIDRKARGAAVPVVPIAAPLGYFGRDKGPQKERGIGVPGRTGGLGCCRLKR